MRNLSANWFQVANCCRCCVKYMIVSTSGTLCESVSKHSPTVLGVGAARSSVRDGRIKIMGKMLIWDGSQSEAKHQHYRCTAVWGEFDVKASSNKLLQPALHYQAEHTEEKHRETASLCFTVSVKPSGSTVRCQEINQHQKKTQKTKMTSLFTPQFLNRTSKFKTTSSQVQPQASSGLMLLI